MKRSAKWQKIGFLSLFFGLIMLLVVAALLSMGFSITTTPWLLSGIILVFSAALCGALIVVVERPFERRLTQLRKSAKIIGAEVGFDSTAHRDEYLAMSMSIQAAHERILQDAKKIKSRQKALEQHLADVAHDLRTPLAALQLELEQTWDHCHDASVRERLTHALQEVVYLASLTEDLRIACKLQDGFDPREGHQRTSLRDVVQQVVARHRVLAKRSGISLEVAYPDNDVIVECDSTSVQQAVGNLVQNAIAYNVIGENIAVVLESTEPNAFVLTVVDDGPGVPPAELPRLGTRTFRTDDARQRNPKGSGLGLAITSEICARCGWELSFASEIPKGLRVTIRGSVV